MKILIVVDVQVDFITGCLGSLEAQKIMPNIVEKVAKYRKNGDKVLFTLDTHFKNSYLETQEGKNLPIEHCLIYTEGHKLMPELGDVTASDRILKVNRFGSPQLAVRVRELEQEHFNEVPIEEPLELELIGVCTDICVISNAMVLKSTLPEAIITVDASCCAGVTPERHKIALEAMKACQIKIINE